MPRPLFAVAILLLAITSTAAEMRMVDDAVVPEASPCSSQAACWRYAESICMYVTRAFVSTDAYGTASCTYVCATTRADQWFGWKPRLVNVEVCN